MGSRIGSRSRTVHQAGLAGLCLVATLTAIATLGTTAALASSVSKSGATLTYSAAAGESNNLIVSLSSGTYAFDDSGATVAPGTGCTTVNSHRATCAGAGITSISVDVGNMNDLAWNTSATASTITGGDGSDTLISGGGADVLIGCTGDDNEISGGGADLLFDNFFNCSGGGNDTFDGGAGADGVFGGAGTDTATYSGRTASVFVSLEDAANDGEAGEGDNVHQDVENVTGGSGDDSFTGGPGANVLKGEVGDDVLVGERSVDQDPVAGGNDSIFGGPGADALAGGDGNNLLSAGVGNDVLQGGLGADSFDGGAGDDDLEALDGVIDTVNCGAGSDYGAADLDDVISPSCEALSLGDQFPDDFPTGDEFPTDCFADDPGGGGVGASGGLDGEAFPSCSSSRSEACSSVRIANRPADLKRGTVEIRVSLPKGTAGVCKAKLRLDALLGKARKQDARKLTIGSEPLSLRGGHAKRFEIQINRTGRRLFDHTERLRVRVNVLVRQDGELSKVASEVVKIDAGGR
jgi:Ca2+-binding RTX toxin-like protein